MNMYLPSWTGMHDIVHQPAGNQALVQRVVQLPTVTKIFLVTVLLLATELVLSWAIVSQVMARTGIGVISYLSLQRILPSDVALTEAQKIAVSDWL